MYRSLLITGQVHGQNTHRYTSDPKGIGYAEKDDLIDAAVTAFGSIKVISGPSMGILR